MITIKIKSNNLYLRRLQSSSTAYNRDSKSVFVASNSVILSVLIVQYDTTWYDMTGSNEKDLSDITDNNGVVIKEHSARK